MRFKIILLTIFITVFADQSIFSQKSEVDRLQALLKTAKEDTNKVTVLNKLAWEYRKNDYQKAYDYAQQALELSNKLKYKQGVAYSYSNIGIVYKIQKNYVKALEYYAKSSKVLEEIGDKRDIAFSYNNIGNINYEQNKYPEALDYYLKALKILKETGKKQYIASCYNNIGNIYNKQKKYSTALDYFFKAFKINKETDNKQGLANSYNNIGTIYKEQNNYDDALIDFNKSIQLAKEIGDVSLMADVYKCLSEIYAENNNYKKAYESYNLYFQYYDSTNSIESKMRFNEIEKKHEFATTDLQISNHELEIETKEKEIDGENKKIKRLTIQCVAFMAGLCLLAFLIARVFRSYRVKKINNEIIAAERQRSEDLLLNILPSETAEELKQYGKSKAKYYDMVTVLFTDIKDFSKISEKMTPEKLVGELDFCFKGFDKIINEFPIEKIRTIGDAYKCAGGLPVANSHNPVDVVKAGLKIQQFMETYKRDRQEKGELFFEVRLGIHTGPVVAGIVGIKKFSYDIWGDTIYIASRMESNGEVGKVNISGDTYEHVKELFACTYRGKIETKDKKEIDMYFVNEQLSMSN